MLVSIDHECKLGAYFNAIREMQITDNEAYVKHLAHYTTDLLFYGCYWVEGIVWQDKFDVSYALGTYVKIIFDKNLQEIP